MANPLIRDTVFRDYFNDQRRMLSLCNALLSTDYSNPDDVEINTLEGGFFSNIKNDISCLLHGTAVTIIEHQSTINPNMPFRCFEYSLELYRKIIAPYRNRFYRTTLVSLPFPYFATIYNGKKPAKPFQTLCLSNAFGGKSHALEVKVDVFNLAYAEELPIANCTFLMQYRTFMDRINTNRLIMTPEQAVQKAARECIADGIMADYLSQKQKEVYHMLAYEWNENDARQSWKEEGIEQGIEQGIDVSFAVMDALRSGFSIEETAEKQHIAIEHVQHIANAMRSRM